MRALLIAAVLSVGVQAAQTETPHVPRPPEPPKPTARAGDVLDSLLLGGVFRVTRENERRAEAVNYEKQLRAFADGLTPEQKAAVDADPVESAALWKGIAYLQVMQKEIAREDEARVRARRAAAAAARQGGVVYSASECIGAIVMGVCHGSVLPNAAYHPTCHGQMLNGMCTGPMF